MDDRNTLWRIYGKWWDWNAKWQSSGWLLHLFNRGSRILPKNLRVMTFDLSWKRRVYEDMFPTTPLPAYGQYTGDIPYVYEDLPDGNYIRLLCLKPAVASDAVIDCTFTLHHIREPPQYEALSYTWGTSRPTYKISCNGKALAVAQNLWRALHRLRRKDKERTLWIDAVCINQQNPEEQGAQVLLMNQIYRRAESVVVWLGDETENSQLAFELIRRILKNQKVAETVQEGKFMLEKDLVTSGLPATYSLDWKAVDAVFWRPWYSRVWIIQEITLAKRATVVCGKDEMSWDNFITAATLISRSGLWQLADITSSQPLSVAEHSYAYHMAGAQGIPLIQLLMKTRYSQATKDIDEVYGVLGLSRDAAELRIDPDYTMSAVSVYTKVAVRHLEMGSLDILSANEDQFWKSLEDLPTWVPDWSTPQRAVPYLFPGDVLPVHTADQRKPELCFSEDKRTLYISGYLVDTVIRICSPNIPMRVKNPKALLVRLGGPSLWLNVLFSVNVRRYRTWERVALGLKSYPTGEEIENIYHRTLIADQFRGATPDVLKMYYEAFKRYMARYPFGDNLLFTGQPDPEEKEGYDMAAAYRNATDRASTARTLFITKDGYMGLGPRSMCPGDKVVALLGGRTPYTLRPSRKGRPYKFIGECYIHGLMDGEVFGLNRDKEEIAIV